jgi:hypothetical protein
VAAIAHAVVIGFRAADIGDLCAVARDEQPDDRGARVGIDGSDRKIDRGLGQVGPFDDGDAGTSEQFDGRRRIDPDPLFGSKG